MFSMGPKRAASCTKTRKNRDAQQRMSKYIIYYEHRSVQTLRVTGKGVQNFKIERIGEQKKKRSLKILIIFYFLKY